MRPAARSCLFLALVPLPAFTVPAHPTAVFTLDVEQREFAAAPGKPIRAQFKNWAKSCSIVTRQPLYALECPPAEPEPRPGTKAEESETIQASLALFRDLNEVLYVAGCPLVRRPSEKAEERRALGSEAAEEKRAGVSAKDLEDCKDIAAGQTFTTEVEEELFKIVIHGRQLEMSLFEVHPPMKTLSGPYELTPSKVRRALGSTSTPGSSRPLEPGAEPKYDPPALDTLSEGQPAAKDNSGVPTAETSLGRGRLVLECPSSQSAVYIEGAYYGTCPLEIPLLAGSHTVVVRRPGQDDWVRDVEIRNGEFTRVKAE